MKQVYANILHVRFFVKKISVIYSFLRSKTKNNIFHFVLLISLNVSIFSRQNLTIPENVTYFVELVVD